MKSFKTALAIGMFAVTSTSVQAATFTAEIESTGPLSGSSTSTIDQWFFSVPTDATIDIAVNGIASVVGNQVDPDTVLYNDDGSLDAGDFRAENDDGGPGVNSAYSILLTAGDYILVVGDFTTSVGQFGPTQTDGGADDGWTYEVVFSDNATVTQVLEGNLDGTFTTTAIPSPTAAIAGLVGLAGLGMRRRRK